MIKPEVIGGLIRLLSEVRDLDLLYGRHGFGVSLCVVVQVKAD